MQRLIRCVAVLVAVAGVVWALSQTASDPPILVASRLAARVLAFAVGAGALWVGSSQAPPRNPTGRESLTIGIIVGAGCLVLGWRQYIAFRAERQAATVRQQSYQQCKAKFDATHDPAHSKDDVGLLLWLECGDATGRQ